MVSQDRTGTASSTDSEKASAYSDLYYLAARLPHRIPHTEGEAEAARFLESRLRLYTSNVTTESFEASPYVYRLLAGLLAEFALVFFISFWFPGVAAVYSAVLLVFFLLEYTGLFPLSGWTSKTLSQNVSGEFISPAPRQHVVLVANYDCPWASPLPPDLTDFFQCYWAPAASFAMVGTLVVLVAEAWGSAIFESLPYAPLAVRGILLLLLLSIALGLLNIDEDEHTRGANFNASGCAALLVLAARLAQSPLRHTDVTVVFVGAQMNGLSGIRHFVKTHTLDRRHSMFIGAEGVGAGTLSVIAREGSLFTVRADKELLALFANAGTPPPKVVSAYAHFPTLTYYPQLRGFRGITLLGLEDDRPALLFSEEDKLVAVDTESVIHAADMVECVLRQLDASEDGYS